MQGLCKRRTRVNPGKEPILLIELYSLLPLWHQNTKKEWKVGDASVTQLEEVGEVSLVVAGVGVVASCFRLDLFFTLRDA